MCYASSNIWTWSRECALHVYQCTDLVCEAVKDKEAVAAEASEMQGGSCLGPDHLTCGVAAAAVACWQPLVREL